MSSVKLGACGQISKILFIIINCIFLAIGLAIIGVGSYLVNQGHDLNFFTGNRVITAAVLLIVCGVILFLITALGVAAAFFQHKLGLYIYLGVVLFIILLEIVAAILGFVYRDTIADSAGEQAVIAIDKYLPSNATNYDPNVNAAIDYIQREFKCCGWNDYTDWVETEYFNITNRFPSSCECITNTTSCMEADETGQDIYGTACKDGVSDSLRNGVAVLGGVGAFFAIIQLAPIILAVLLIYTIHKATSAYVTV